jgi:hypothetical protein
MNGNVIRHPEKRYHLLSGGVNTKQNYNTEDDKKEHRSDWLHGVIDPEDPKFSNLGQIRAYPMQVADQRPQPDAEYIRKLLNITEIPATQTYTAQVVGSEEIKGKGLR